MLYTIGNNNQTNLAHLLLTLVHPALRSILPGFGQEGRPFLCRNATPDFHDLLRSLCPVRILLLELRMNHVSVEHRRNRRAQACGEAGVGGGGREMEVGA